MTTPASIYQRLAALERATRRAPVLKSLWLVLLALTDLTSDGTLTEDAWVALARLMYRDARKD